MAAWRRKAVALFPELAEEFGEGELGRYSVFFELLPFVREAHKRADDDALRRVYGYAQWCHHQRRGSDLRNAVGTSFYEHLFDDWSLRRSVLPWLSPAVRRDIWPLWAARLTAEQIAELHELERGITTARWRDLRSESS